jgi:SNF family Na+-dependent transporter
MYWPEVFMIQGFFYDEILKYGTKHVVIWENLIPTAITFLFCLLITFKGSKFVSYVVYFTMPVPVVFLIIIAIQGASLEGSGDGINN